MRYIKDLSITFHRHWEHISLSLQMQFALDCLQILIAYSIPQWPHILSDGPVIMVLIMIVWCSVHQVQKETESILERNSDLLQQNSTLKSEISELNASVENQKLKLCDARDELSRLKDNLKHKSKQTSKLKVSCRACVFSKSFPYTIRFEYLLMSTQCSLIVA